MASKRYDLKVQMVKRVLATLKFTVGELWNRIPARFTNNLINIRHRLAGSPLHDQSAIFVLPSYYFALDNYYYPVTLQAHGAWYHVQVLINITIQVQCLFVTWLPRYKLLAFTKRNHEDQNQFSLPL